MSESADYQFGTEPFSHRVRYDKWIKAVEAEVPGPVRHENLDQENRGKSPDPHVRKMTPAFPAGRDFANSRGGL